MEVSASTLNLLQDAVRRRAGHVTVSYQGKIYLWGGYMEEVKEATYNLMTQSSVKYHEPHHIWIYEPLINIWYRKFCSGDVPVHLSGAYFASSGNYLYIFGGYCGAYDETSFEGVQNILWRLCLDTFVWELVFADGDPPFPADKGTSWFYKDRFYVFGGFGTMEDYPIRQEPYRRVRYVSENENLPGSRGWFDQLVYYDKGENMWVWPKCTGCPPTPRAAHAATVVGDVAYIFGGRHKEFRLNDLYSLNLKSHTWSTIETTGPLPAGRSWHSLTALSDHQLVLYGGFSTTCQVLKDVWSFDLTRKQWKHMRWIKSGPRLWHCSVNNGPSEIIALGGVSNNLLDSANAKEHAEDMLSIRFSPPSLFKLVLEYLSNNTAIVKQSHWNHLTPFLKFLLEKRTDPFEVHGL